MHSRQSWKETWESSRMLHMVFATIATAYHTLAIHSEGSRGRFSLAHLASGKNSPDKLGLLRQLLSSLIFCLLYLRPFSSLVQTYLADPQLLAPPAHTHLPIGPAGDQLTHTIRVQVKCMDAHRMVLRLRTENSTNYAWVHLLTWHVQDPGEWVYREKKLALNTYNVRHIQCLENNLLV